MLDWWEFFKIERFESERAEIRNGKLCQVTVAMAGNKSKPADFMYEPWPEPERELTDEEIDRIMGGILGA